MRGIMKITENVVKGSNGKNDECYTHRYAVEPILKFIKPNSTIWCPFDKDDSEFVKVFKENGFNVINTHIDYGQDFYQTEIKECDYMIRNRFYLNETGIKNTATRIRDIAQFYIEEPEWKEE